MATDNLVCKQCGTTHEPIKKGTDPKGNKRYRCKQCGSQAKRITRDDFVKRTDKKIKMMEKRFLEVANLQGDLSVYPLTEETHLQVTTDKEKSNKYSEVFTPLWLVDKMLDKTNPTNDDDYNMWNNNSHTTMDMCAGYGQFTIRMIRKKMEVMRDNDETFNVDNFLSTTHTFNELQISSCFKLMYIFGTDINLFIGDSRELPSLRVKDDCIMYHFSKDSSSDADDNFGQSNNFGEFGWQRITDEIKTIFKRHSLDSIEQFVEDVEIMLIDKENDLKSLNLDALRKEKIRVDNKNREQKQREKQQKQSLNKSKHSVQGIMEF